MAMHNEKALWIGFVQNSTEQPREAWKERQCLEEGELGEWEE